MKIGLLATEITEVTEKLLLFSVLSVFSAIHCVAQLPTARLLTIFPAGGKVGSTCSLTVAGIDLEEAKAIQFAHSNIVAHAQTNGTFTVSIGTNVPPGIYDARVVGKYGISNPRAFAVGNLEEMTEKQNDAPESPMEVAIGTTVNGRAEANALDYYKFQATNGQRVMIVCEAAKIDSRMDPSMALYRDGRELMQCRRGGVLEFTATQSGQYVLKVHDVLFGGGNEHYYRLSLPAKEAAPEKAYAEQETLTPPCEVEGQFYPAGDVDRYSFEAKKGEVYWIELFSHRLGLPTDPLLLVNEQEFNDLENVGGVEFRTNSRDAVGRFEAKEDGTCRIQVRDLFGGLVSDARHVYRLAVRKETPDFELVALPQGPPPKKDSREVVVWSSVLRRGETIPIKVVALRRDGFKGEITVQASDLPAGITSSELVIPGDKNSGTLLVSASGAATNFAGNVSIVSKASAGIRVAKAGTVIWNVPDHNTEVVRSRIADSFALAVCDEVTPITVAAAEAKAYEVPAAGKLAIPLNVTRNGEFNEAFKLKAYGVPALDSLKEVEVKEKGTNATVELDLSQQKLGPGKYTFYLQGQTKGKYRRTADKTSDVTITVYSAPIAVKVSPPQTAANHVN